MAIVPLFINHLAANCMARVRFSVPTMLPESMRYGDRVDAGVLPPGRLVADPVQKPVMDATKRNSELIAHLAPERSRLHVLEVMRIAGPAAADEAGLLGDIAQMLLVAMPAWHRNCQYALVDGDWFRRIGGGIFYAHGCGDRLRCALLRVGARA